ncbi:hypothetical protein GCM10027089_59390 [Nocardia thraciensis]
MSCIPARPGTKPCTASWAPRHPAQQVQNRQRDRDQHAVQHTQGEHRHRRPDRQHQLTAPEARDAPELGRIDQLQRREHHEPAQCRRGETRENPSGPEQYGQHGAQRDDRVQLRACSGDIREGGAAPAAAHRKSVQHTGGHIGRSERTEFGVGIDGPAVPGGKGPCGECVIGESDNRDAHGGQHELHEIRHRHPIDTGHGKPGRYRPDDSDSVLLQREYGDDQGRPEHHQQWTRHSRGPPVQHEQAHQHDDAHGRRRPMHLRQIRYERAHLRGNGLPRNRHAGHPLELPCDHDSRRTRQIPDQHRLRQQIRQHPQPGHGGDQADRAHQHGEDRRQRRVTTRIPHRQRRQRDSGEQGGCRLRPHRQLTRGTDQPSAAHSPTTGGPATVAYAITWGTR